MFDRRQCLVGLAAGCGATLLAPWAHASIAFAITLDELATTSQHAVVGTPRESFSQWEVIGRARRIVTYTRLQVEELLDERPPAESEVLVRTLGGRVDRVAQVVPGEAELLPGKPSSLFLQANRAGDAFLVTAMSQGHFPLRPDARGVPRLQVSPHLPDLKNVERSAARLLRGRTVADVRDLVQRALRKDP